MNLELIISGIIGIVTTLTSSIIAWLSAKKKYYTEVDSNEISNLKSAIQIYNDTIKTIREEVELARSNNDKNQVEIYRLKGVIVKILNIVCTDEVCKKRKFLSEKEAGDILKTMSDTH